MRRFMSRASGSRSVRHALFGLVLFALLFAAMAPRSAHASSGRVSVWVGVSGLQEAFTLSYTAGSGGSIGGTQVQVVGQGMAGETVTAKPDVGHHFVEWSDGAKEATRTDSGVTADMSVTALFAINTYTVTYVTGPNGMIDGVNPQTVEYGASGSAVTPVPRAGYRWVVWTDGSPAWPRADTNVTQDMTITADFVVDDVNGHWFLYYAREGGWLEGPPRQLLYYNYIGAVVEARASAGYHFTGWSDNMKSRWRSDSNIGTDRYVHANFEPDAPGICTVYYYATPGGGFNGYHKQTLEVGESASPIMAVGNPGYQFLYWSDGVRTATRTDTNVQKGFNVTAVFGPSLPIAYVYIPKAPATMRKGAYATIYGYVAGKHSSGTYLVKLRFYKQNSSGAYVYHHSKYARRYYYSSTKTKYKASVSLPHSGNWRVSAYHVCSKHTGYEGGYDYITVR